jgi:CHAT domain-containing protein
MVLEELHRVSRLDVADARYSGLMLATPSDRERHERHDDLLQAWEIAEMRLACETVVLSSCSAAMDDVVHGEGMVGIVHALQFAGARQVLAPLWPIDDQVAPDILANLYAHIEDGCSLDEAMRRTRHDFRHANPAHVACWSVYGPASQAAGSI